MKKKAGKGFIIAIAFIIALLAVFVFALILALTQEVNIGNHILLISGLFDLLVAVILYKVLDHQIKYTCPECGEKRDHHRKFLKTTEKTRTGVSNQRVGPNGYAQLHYTATEYTHFYLDSYVCPKCGATSEFNVQKSGGSCFEYENGQVRDTHRDPVEF